MNVKNWNFSYKGKGEVKQHILDSISLWGAIGLLWYSFLSIIKEHFPEFLGDGLDWLVIGIFLVVLWLGSDWPKKYLKRLALPCHLAGLMIPIGYVVANFEKIADGVVDMAWLYLPHWNLYYKTNLYMGMPNQAGNIVIAFTAFCMIFWWLVWTLAYTLKKRVLLVLFPVIALSIELLVGLSPKENGLYFAVFGVMLLTTLGGSSVVKKAIVLACVALSLILSNAIFDEDIKELATAKKKQEILALQRDFSWENLVRLIQIDFHFNWEKLGNNAPQFTGKTVLEIQSNEQPGSTVYIKGFYGTNYNNGNWNYDDSAFKSACKEAGKSTDEVAKQIFQMPFDRWDSYNKSMITSTSYDYLEYKILYTGTTGDVAYVPYASDYASLDDAYTLMGDYLLKKSVLDNEVSGKRQIFNCELSGWWSVNEAIEYGFGRTKISTSSYYSSSSIKIDLTNQIDELEFINRLSDAYLQVPEDAKVFLEDAHAAITEEMKSSEQNDKYAGISYEDSENYRRIRYGTNVANYLKTHMWYSMKLDTLPMGKDPIDYALNESYEGYCMHFASAATLLLRQGGVPARYVSGYAVDKSKFYYDPESGVYKAEVGDFMAHAWVEVYLDYIGWVPLEVTPGSSLENLPSQDDLDRWESIAESRRDEVSKEPTQSESEESETTEESEESESTSENSELDNPASESESVSDSQEETPNGSEQENPGGIGNGGGNLSAGEWVKFFGIAAALLLTVIGAGLAIRYGVNRYRDELKKEIEKKMTKKAVSRINRRMYRMLRLQNPKLWFTGKMSDIEYEDALANQYTEISKEEWKQFMEIVKKNHYSKEMISIEEMMYCYKCYKGRGHKKRK